MSVGAENVLRHETPCYRIDTSLIDCDYISYLETGKPEFHGEYMSQYSRAEDTCAFLPNEFDGYADNIEDIKKELVDTGAANDVSAKVEDDSKSVASNKQM